MKNHHSAHVDHAESPFAIADPSADERIAAQDRFNAARREIDLVASRLPSIATGPPGWRFGRLLRLAAVLMIAGSASAAAQTDPGAKLVGSLAVGPAEQGWSVALSADGNTAIVGGVTDNKLTGAAWIFRRSGDVWTQPGGKLVGTGAVGQGGQGFAVALSADGTTAIVGGPHDNANTGAASIYVRSGDL